MSIPISQTSGIKIIYLNEEQAKIEGRKIERAEETRIQYMLAIRGPGRAHMMSALGGGP